MDINFEDLDHKYKQVQNLLEEMGSVVVAFSGGVDSTLLLKIARETLGRDQVLAITADSGIRRHNKKEEAAVLAEKLDTRHEIINTEELKNEDFVRNDRQRCYYCKQILFEKLTTAARKRGYNYVVDGTNYSDSLKEDRPGLKALKEYEIKTPLLQAGLTKEEIRELSQKLELPTWDQASDTCLATRFSHELIIKQDVLEKLRQVEAFLDNLDLEICRARLDTEDSLRIEVLPPDMETIMDKRQQIVDKSREAGFKFVSLDLQGYKSGSMYNP